MRRESGDAYWRQTSRSLETGAEALDDGETSPRPLRRPHRGARGAGPGRRRRLSLIRGASGPAGGEIEAREQKRRQRRLKQAELPLQGTSWIGLPVRSESVREASPSLCGFGRAVVGRVRSSAPIQSQHSV